MGQSSQILDFATLKEWAKERLWWPAQQLNDGNCNEHKLSSLTLPK